MPMETNPYIEKIKDVRKRKHLTQQEMAERMGFKDAKEYSRIETGERRLTLELLETVAHVFELTVIELLSYDEKASFNHCTGAMSVHGDNTYHEANAALVAELKEHIQELREEVLYLRQKLDAQLEGRQ